MTGSARLSVCVLLAALGACAGRAASVAPPRAPPPATAGEVTPGRPVAPPAWGCLADAPRLAADARRQARELEVASVEEVGARWERALAEAGWDAEAPPVRLEAERLGAWLVARLADEREATDDAHAAVRLLAELASAGGAPTLRHVLAEPRCAPSLRGLAALGLARSAEPDDRGRLADALAAAVPEGRAPAPHAFTLCEAAQRAFPGAAFERASAAAERLFLFAPHVAMARCSRLVVRRGSAAATARRVLDDPQWPYAVDGADDRDRAILTTLGRGAALIVLGELRTSDALPRLLEAARTRTLQTRATRDGAIQGLAALALPEARRELRAMVTDADRRAPRVAHALLRLGDVAAADALREAALDRGALVEMRLSAANAYTLLATGSPQVADGWVSGLEAAGPIGSPFEALDARLGSFHARLAVAARCGRRVDCWIDAAHAADPQERARALWQLPRLGRDPRVTDAFVEAAVDTLEHTPPDERHDAVVGAVVVLRYVEADRVRPHRSTIRRARVAWEGRTSPMGLPIDIPLALLQLERDLAP